MKMKEKKKSKPTLFEIFLESVVGGTEHYKKLKDEITVISSVFKNLVAAMSSLTVAVAANAEGIKKNKQANMEIQQMLVDLLREKIKDHPGASSGIDVGLPDINPKKDDENKPN